MNKKDIIIQQTLHGYSSGHHLLESSIPLSDDSKRKMDILSDLSGSEVSEEFDFYYSGYFLETEQVVVLAKTWYAPEMPRPGCVWTQSLLIELDQLDFCAENIELLLSQFKRPSVEGSPKMYSEPLVISNTENIKAVYDDKKIQYLIWVMLGQNAPNYIVTKYSQEYIMELLFIWFTCYQELSYDYSFITGTNFVKSDSANLISLQFCSENVRNKLSHSLNNITLMKNIDDVRKFPPWVMSTYHMLINGIWNKFLKFKNLFCNDIKGEISLTMFIKLYTCFYIGNKTIDIYGSLELIDKIFEDKKSIVGNKLLDLYFKDSFEEWGSYKSFSNIIIATIKFQWINMTSEALESLILNGFAADISSSKKIVQYLVKIDNSQMQEKYLTVYANSLSPNSFEEFSEMDYSICNVLIAINPALAECRAIWKQSIGFQQGIFNSLKISKKVNSLDKNILKIILDTSEFDFANEIYMIWGEKSIPDFLKYLLGIEHLCHKNTSRMFELCKQHSYIASHLFEKSFTKLSREQIINLFRIIDPYADKLSSEGLISVFSLLNIKKSSKYQENEIADFYLPCIICTKDIFPDVIVAFTVTNVHDRLSKLVYPEEKWEKLQKSLPEATVFNQWDRCKRLRKAIKKKGYRIKQLSAYNDNELDIHLL